jgi:hypothetical protein
MDESVTKAVLGNTISPMLSSKTSFAMAMTELSDIHHKAIKSFASDDRRRTYLPIIQPCFMAKFKLDGERIVCHINQGRITMQTRNDVWYSDLYCPCLAPAIRKAMSKWDVNVILDGEVLSWDNGRKEHARFGMNRAVAQARKMWMEETGLLEKRDLNLHSRESNKNVMSASAEQPPKDSSMGRNCWLKYVLFDVLYVDGPSAHALLSLALGCDVANNINGSMVHLSCFERKRILHSLIERVQSSGACSCAGHSTRWYFKARRGLFFS